MKQLRVKLLPIYTIANQNSLILYKQYIYIERIQNRRTKTQLKCRADERKKTKQK